MSFASLITEAIKRCIDYFCTIMHFYPVYFNGIYLKNKFSQVFTQRVTIVIWITTSASLCTFTIACRCSQEPSSVCCECLLSLKCACRKVESAPRSVRGNYYTRPLNAKFYLQTYYTCNVLNQSVYTKNITSNIQYDTTSSHNWWTSVDHYLTLVHSTIISCAQ